MEERILTAANKARSTFYDKLYKELGVKDIPLEGPAYSAFVDATNELAQQAAKSAKKYPLSFKKFIETRRFEVVNQGAAHEIYGGSESMNVPVFHYDNGYSISILPSGQFWVILCNEEHTSYNIADVEAELYAYYLSNF